MDWLDAYEISSAERSSQLGHRATLTVILRDLADDSRSHAFIPVDPAPSGAEQRETILRAMAGLYPDARWKTYNKDKQVASFVGRDHLYIVIYEEHEVEDRTPMERPTLFAT